MPEEILTPQDQSNQADEVSSYTPHLDAPTRIHHAWAKVENGIVTSMKLVQSHLPHPFQDHEAAGGRVINVTSVPCAVGYVVDTHGNVAPPPVVRADATLIAPSMPAPGAQAAAVQAGPVEDKAISQDEMNDRRAELIEASKEHDADKPSD